MKRPVEKLEENSGFTLMEVSLSVGIAASWILLSIGLMGLLVDQVRHHRQEPVWEQSDDKEEVPAPIQLKLPRMVIEAHEPED